MLGEGTAASPFDLPLVGGGRATLAEYRREGRAVLVVFFKTECPTCKLAFPILQRMWKRASAAEEPAGFLAIAQNAPGEIPGFCNNYGATFPVATEGDPYAVSNAYEVTNVPTLYIVDENGVIVRARMGFSRADYDELSADLTARGGKSDARSLFTASDSGLPLLQPG
jgi:peroxiredoxin